MTLTTDGILELLHLERQRTTASRVAAATGLFLAGGLVGAALTALLTPKSGPELRGDLKDLSGTIKERTIDPLVSRAQEAVRSPSSPKV